MDRGGIRGSDRSRSSLLLLRCEVVCALELAIARNGKCAEHYFVTDHIPAVATSSIDR